MSTLAELRERVRLQTETDSGELTDAEIDGWLYEAFNRTIAAEVNWPFLEEVWTLTLTAGETTMAMPTDADANGVVSLVDTERPSRLGMIEYENAENMFLDQVVSAYAATQYSIWNAVIYLWPTSSFDDDREYRLRGWRKPVDWIALGASSEPDCDVRLHRPLANYAISLAYAQQEDMEMERNYMERWLKDVEMARMQIMEPAQNRPLVMGPRYVTAIGQRWTF